MFNNEIRLYEEEGIEVKVSTCPDNAECLKLLSHRPNGIIPGYVVKYEFVKYRKAVLLRAGTSSCDVKGPLMLLLTDDSVPRNSSSFLGAASLWFTFTDVYGFFAVTLALSPTTPTACYDVVCWAISAVHRTSLSASGED